MAETALMGSDFVFVFVLLGLYTDIFMAVLRISSRPIIPCKYGLATLLLHI